MIKFLQLNNSIKEKVETGITDKLDFYLLFSSVLLIVFGLLSIYSSTYNILPLHINFYKQLIFAIAGIGIGLIVYFLPPKFFDLLSIPFYLFSLFLLILVIFFGKKVSGNQNWLTFGFISLQPSEIAKFAVILALAHLFNKEYFNINSIKGFLMSGLIVAVPTILIIFQKDIGTALVFFSIFVFGLFWSGLSAFSVFVLICPAIASFASILGIIPLLLVLTLIILILIYFKRDFFLSLGIFALNLSAVVITELLFHLLSPYQVNRIKNFLDPNFDPLGSGYNAIQAKIAVGSGGLFGKGFLAGSQTQLKFIPEQWTDFIFCVIGEEFGFVGSFFVLSLLMIMILRILKIATLAKDEFLSLLLAGILAIYFVHIFINIGMVVGIMPIIGIPLPFVSYGGSSLVANMFLLGIAANIYRTRKNYT